MAKYVALVVTAFLCGLVAAGIAKAKGRNPVQWFFVGALLNVVALGAILVYSSRQSPTKDLPS